MTHECGGSGSDSGMCMRVGNGIDDVKSGERERKGVRNQVRKHHNHNHLFTINQLLLCFNTTSYPAMPIYNNNHNTTKSFLNLKP